METTVQFPNTGVWPSKGVFENDDRTDGPWRDLRMISPVLSGTHSKDLSGVPGGPPCPEPDRQQERGSHNTEKGLVINIY